RKFSNQTAGGGTGGSYAENRTIGETLVDAHLMPVFSTTEGAAYTISPVTRRSPSATALRRSSYIGLRFGKTSLRITVSEPLFVSIRSLASCSSPGSMCG